MPKISAYSCRSCIGVHFPTQAGPLFHYKAGIPRSFKFDYGVLLVVNAAYGGPVCIHGFVLPSGIGVRIRLSRRPLNPIRTSFGDGVCIPLFSSGWRE
jgi:hypothetical protein